MTDEEIKNLDGTTFKWMNVNRIMFGITEITKFRIIQKSLSNLNLILAAKGLTTTRKKEIEDTIKSKA